MTFSPPHPATPSSAGREPHEQRRRNPFLRTARSALASNTSATRAPSSTLRQPVVPHEHAHYDLRHSYGTALYRVAGDTRLVKDVLGHSDTRMTERYTLGHVPAAVRLATSRFEKHLEVPDAPPPARERTARGTGD